MLDVAKRTGNDQVVGLIEEVLDAAPELQVLPIRYKKGTSYTTLKRTAFTGGGFRKTNEGTEVVKSSYVKQLVEMFFFDAQMEVDEALVAADPSLLTDEAVGVTRGSLINLGKQVFAGLAEDSGGFDGFKNLVDASMVVDAGGTGDDTHTVYFVVANDQGVTIPMNEETLLQLGEWVRQKLKDDDGKSYHAFCNNLRAWIGLQVGHKFAVGVIKNITAAKPLTDDLGHELEALFPVGMKATHAFMSRQAKLGLRKSRNAVGAQKSNGKGDASSPMPTEIADVPIVTTDSIDTVAAW